MSENYLLDVLTEARKPPRRRRRYTRLDYGLWALTGVTLALGIVGYWWSDTPGIGIIFLAIGFSLAFQVRR